MAIRARFKGRVSEDGVAELYYNGIPARDLSGEEYEALDSDQKHRVRYGDLYAMADAKPAKAKDEAAASTPTAPEGG